jgi:DNA ligase-1
MECSVHKDIPDPYTKGIILFTKGQIITVNAGCMTHAERIVYWENPDKILGAVIKFKFFPKGIKDKPRFPNFQAIRGKADI